MSSKLPLLSKMLLPAIATIRRGVKVKPGGILIQRNFQRVSPDLKGIESYLHFMDISVPDPLTYLYILAQRAQAAVMLDKSFTIAIPGLVHLENSLEQFSAFNLRQTFDLYTEVVVDAKDTGSLIPRFKVVFFQDGKQVAECNSIYLARRKSLPGTAINKVHNETELTRAVIFREVWDLPGQTSVKYARVSGDHNPIHTHKLAAKLAGFRLPVMHGWYGVGRIVCRAECETKRTFQKIMVTFKSPIFLPGRQAFELYSGTGESLHFALINTESGRMAMSGVLS